ncbi:MAG: HlyD family efflux transporter periplasmic adaptor subunit [Proteobacteria bacterium]|nr:HlyD family efflux transporter periplasmic adaptor subunit [Pseudomonadota bacterium]
MKKILLFLLVFMCTGCQQKSAGLNGYVEGEYLRIAPTSGGILEQLDVKTGDAVMAGQKLFSLDLTTLKADRDNAAAVLAQAAANLANLTKGKRPEEIAIFEQQKAQALADFQNAQSQLNRTLPLTRKGYVTKAQRDADQAAYDRAKAHVAELEAQLQTAFLGGREDEVVAARAIADAAGQKLVQAEKLLNEASPLAPAAGRIEDIFYRPGEFVPAGMAVVSLLPPENIKVRFFVAEKMVSQIRQGMAVKIRCDGCNTAIEGKVTFISSQAEYTPPVIYSVESRDKLVFMIEARPNTPDPALHPGLPVDIDLQNP